MACLRIPMLDAEYKVCVQRHGSDMLLMRIVRAACTSRVDDVHVKVPHYITRP
jgi:hypothetical protein